MTSFQDRHSLPILLAIYLPLVWLQDTSWTKTPADALPLLIALPLFAWLGRPWTWTSGPHKLSIPPLLIAALLIILGITTGIALFPALGWTALLWSWLSPRLTPDAQEKIKRLLPLPIMASPWLLLDGRPLGWWFRLTGAQATEKIFSFFQVDVLRQGTYLMVGKIPVDVAPACSGLNTLQALLIAGIALTFLELGESPLYWVCIPLLVALAWTANTLRIIAITATALIYGIEATQGLLHTLGGEIILMVIFLLCIGTFRLMARHKTSHPGHDIP